MIILGIVLIVLGYILPLPILMTLGLILVAIGIIFWVMGGLGRPVGGRRYWY